MASAPAQKYDLTDEEYLTLERRAETSKAGGTSRHGLVTVNLASELRQHLKQRPCRVYSGDLRVKIPAAGIYYYPDLSVVCGEPLFEDGNDRDLLNPILIVEVLSSSTESHDRGEKFQNYQMLSSLKEYVLVAQDRPHVEHYLRQAGRVWLYTAVSGLANTISLSSVGCQIPLAEIFDKVNFP